MMKRQDSVEGGEKRRGDSHDNMFYIIHRTTQQKGDSHDNMFYIIHRDNPTEKGVCVWEGGGKVVSFPSLFHV